MKDKRLPDGLDKKTADELLYRSLRAVYHYERRLEELFSLGYQEIYLLQLLRRRESARVGEIATALGIRVFSATRLVQRLEAAGLVSKRRDERDGRGVEVSLEAAGATRVDDIEAHNYELLVGNASSLEPGERAAFITVARRLDGVLGVSDRVGEDD